MGSQLTALTRESPLRLSPKLPKPDHKLFPTSLSSFERSSSNPYRNILPFSFSSIPLQAPTHRPPAPIGLRLQRKLAVGSAHDPLEAQADEMAEHIMSMASPTETGVVPTSSPQTLQRKCSCEEGGGKCKQCEEKQQKLQRKAQGGIVAPVAAPPIVHDVLRSPGQPIDAATRAFMEPRFGRDFSRVRLHTETRAAESARLVNALAYTVGDDIVFGEGAYSPGSAATRRLLAHELAHTLQQSASPLRLQRACLTAAECAAPQATLQNFVATTVADPKNVSKAAKRKADCGKVPPDPKCTSDGHGAKATALTAIMAARYPTRLTYITGIFIDKDIPDQWGAYTTACSSFTPALPGATCTFVPAPLEAQAKQFQSGSKTINGSSATDWLTAAIGTLTHETGHAHFNASPPIAPLTPTSCKFTDFKSNLSEMAAHFSEMHVFYRAALAKPAKDRFKRFEQMFDFWVKNGFEDISGIVKDLRCRCECDDANNFIIKTFESVASTQKWDTNEQFMVHTELSKPKWKLNWPITPPSVNVADLPTTAPAPLKFE